MQASGLISVNDVVEQRFHHIFKHATFNHMQSAILEQSLKDDCNMVVAAPTGSGKTVIHELAIIKLIAQNSKKPIKVVYVAPNKALCQQKLREWDEKFTRLGQVVMEVTGDIDLKQSMRFVAKANVIITTPEKWDSLTRVWKDHIFLLGAVDLLLIDEVHHLGEDRGATLEALVVRMKMLSSVYIERLHQSSPNTEKPLPMRIIALSATLPNLADIGEWLGCRQESTHYFDESFRPVPLTVHTLSMGSMNNAFLFDKSLDERVGPLVQRYSEGKQVLIFCASKKSTESLGSLLCQRIPIPPGTISLARAHAHLIESAQDPTLRDLLHRGVAYHHSGVCPDDRALVEQLYLLGAVYILCCTSTLAHGVNLPAHLVIIKGTSSWRGGSRGYERTSRADVIQMLGRAGRQGLDDTGVAVIMTSREDQEYYADVSLNAEIVESKLQSHLVEAICAEITQTVITNVEDCLAWMRNTFFYVRVRKNPAKYGFDPISDVDQLNTVLSITCIKAIQDLSDTGLIVYHADTQHITPLPEALVMTRNLIKFPTMQILVQIPPQSILPQLLRELSHSPELHKPVRRLEKATLNDLMKHTRYPLKLRVQDPWHKVYVLMQAAIGRTEIKDFTLRVEQAEIVECALRVLSALRELGVCREVGALLECTLLLDRSLRTRMWECHYGSIFLQCPALSPTVRNSLTLRNVRTIGDVMGCSLSTVQDMCGGSQAEARAILALAKALYEGSLEVKASILKGVLTITVASTTHGANATHYTVQVDANYPQYTLLAYNVTTSKALCIRNIDRGTRSTQHCVNVDPVLSIEHVKCCLLCTNYVGIDSYQQAVVEVPNTVSDGTTDTSNTTSSSRKKVNPTTPSTNNINSVTTSDANTPASGSNKPSPARNLKQTTLRTTSVVDEGPQAGLHGTPYGVRTTTTGYKNPINTLNNHSSNSSYDCSATPATSDSTAGLHTGNTSISNSEAIQRAQAFMNRAKNGTSARGNIVPTAAPSVSNNTGSSTATVGGTTGYSTTHDTTTNSYSSRYTNDRSSHRTGPTATANTSTSNKQPFSKFAYTDIDDAALGLDDDYSTHRNTNQPYSAHLTSTGTVNTQHSYSEGPMEEEMVYDGEDISDYYYPTSNKTLPLVTPSVQQTGASTGSSYRPNKPNNTNTSNAAYKPTSNAGRNHKSGTPRSVAEHQHTDSVSGDRYNNVSNEVSAMRRKAMELNLMSLPVQRINRSQRMWGNTSGASTINTAPTPAPIATVSPPSYSSPTKTSYPTSIMHNNNSNSNNSNTSRKRSFFDQDGPVIPLCEEFDHTASDHYYNNNNYNNYANYSDSSYNNTAPGSQRTAPSAHARFIPYPPTNGTALTTRDYCLPAQYAPAPLYHSATSGKGKENCQEATNYTTSLPATVPVEHVPAQPPVSHSVRSAFAHKVSAVPEQNNYYKDDAPKGVQKNVHLGDEFESIFF